MRHDTADLRRSDPPAAGPSVAGAALTLPPRPAPAGGGASILLVDDDRAVCEGLRRVLATEGWRIDTANAGAEALEYLQEHHPDLVITDLRMAPVSGWDLLFHEKIQRPQLPIFVITALSRQATGEAARFATEFFRKPVDLDALLAAVRRHLARPING